MKTSHVHIFSVHFHYMFITFSHSSSCTLDHFGKFSGVKLGISQSPGDQSLELKSFGEAPTEDLFLGKMQPDVFTCTIHIS